MRPEIGKWTFVLRSRKDYARMESGWRVFEFSIFKMTSWPEPGVRMAKDNYTGFRIVFRYWLPIEGI